MVFIIIIIIIIIIITFWFWAGDATTLEVLKGLVHKSNAWERQEYEYHDVNLPRSSYKTLCTSQVLAYIEIQHD